MACLRTARAHGHLQSATHAWESLVCGARITQGLIHQHCQVRKLVLHTLVPANLILLVVLLVAPKLYGVHFDSRGWHPCTQSMQCLVENMDKLHEEPAALRDSVESVCLVRGFT